MTGLPFRFDAPALARNAPYGDRAMDMPWADVHKIARLRRITGSFLASRLQFPSPEVPQTVGGSNEAGAPGHRCRRRRLWCITRARSRTPTKERLDGSAEDPPRRPALLQRPVLEGLHGPDGRHQGPDRRLLREVGADRRRAEVLRQRQPGQVRDDAGRELVW